MPAFDANQLQLAPQGAGDLIDRAVRLYRRHFFTLLRIAAAPVMISAFGWVMWTIGIREVGNTATTSGVLFYGFLIFAAVVVIAAGHIFGLIVMGGASRNL